MAYRQSFELKDLAIDPDEMLAVQRRASRKRLVAVVIAFVVLAGAGALAAVVVQARGKTATRLAYGRFATCLIGDASATGERPSLRVRNTQLASMTTPTDKRFGNQDEWPTRCGPLAHAFGAAVRDSGGAAELASAADRLGKALGAETAFEADLSALVDGVFVRAAAEPIPYERADVPLPPLPAKPLSLLSLPKDVRMFGAGTTLSSLHVAPFSDATLRFVVDDKDLPNAPATCALAPGQSEIACKAVPPPAATLSPALRPWGTTENLAHPFVFAGVRGKAGIFDAETGARFVDKLEYGAYGASSLDDGTFAYLVWNDKPSSTHLVTMRKDGTRGDKLVVERKESGNPYYSSALFWRHAAYRQIRKGVDGIRLIVRTIDATELGPPVDIGRIDEVGHIEGGSEEEPHLTACRSDATTVIRAKGWENTYLAFKTKNGHWSPPIESHGLSGVLTCGSGGAATVTRPWGGRVGSRYKGAIEQSACTASGCDERSVDIPTMMKNTDDVMPREAKDIRAVDVDGKLLVVWRAGDRGGLRMRLAPIDRIAAESDIVVFDDQRREGAPREESALVDFAVLPAAHGAVLLLGTVEGVFAFFVGAHEMPKPLKTRL